jgi:hypothetical protein
MRPYKHLILASVLLNTACATIITGTRQDVYINAAQKVNCNLVDSNNAAYAVVAPGTVNVERGDGPLHITCTDGKNKGYRSVSDGLEPWFLGNLVAGGIIGVAVDASNGAYQKYPDEITINLMQ